MDKNTVLKLAPNILKRMEYKVNVFYLFNIETDEIWTGNEAAGLFISQINGKNSINDLLLILKEYFEDYTEEILFSSIVEVFDELLKMNFLQIIK